MAQRRTFFLQPIKGIDHMNVGRRIIVWLVALANVVIMTRAQMMPAMFILGDSLVDNGNNNYILTLAKSNFPPNGLDFQLGPTGRFCNGRTVADVIGNQSFTEELSPAAKTLVTSLYAVVFDKQYNIIR